MKIKNLLAVGLLSIGLSAYADGYRDGIDYFKAGQYDNSRTILNRNLNAPGTDQALVYYYLGQLDLIDGNKAAAKANFDKGISLNSENPYNYVGLGAIQLLEGQQKAAEENFKTAQKFGKKNNEITVDIARAYFNADPVKYSEQIKKHLEKAHKDSKNQEPSIYILEGDMELANNDLGGAATKYEQAITFDPSNPEGYVKYANAYIVVNPAFAVQKLEELLAAQPTSALAQRELAEKYYNTSQWTKAAQQYGTYIQNPNHFPEDKARYSVLLFANNEFQNSLNVADELLAVTPNDFQMQRIRMLNLNALERYAEAEKAAESFFALTPTGNAKFTPNDHITFANVLQNLQQDSLAILQYEAAVNIDPTRADNLSQLSTAYYHAKKYQQAAETYEKYREASGNNSLNDAYTASARWLMAAANAGEDTELRNANADKGILAVTEVINGTSPVPDYQVRLARFYLIKNDNTPDEQALNIYKKVIEMLDSDPENANPQNPNNRLKMYVEAYRIIGNYYQLHDMTEEQNEAYKKLDEYNALLGQ